MIKFKNLEMDYYFGETKSGKKVVTCKIIGYAEDTAINSDYISSNGIDDGLRTIDQYVLEEDRKNCQYVDSIRYVFTGKAVLADGDEYDEERGKKIAESKAKLKMFHKENDLNARLSHILHRLVCDLSGEICKRHKILVKEEEHLDKLIG